MKRISILSRRRSIRARHKLVALRRAQREVSLQSLKRIAMKRCASAQVPATAGPERFGFVPPSARIHVLRWPVF